MKMRRNRLIVASLFLVWIGGMYFFLVGQHHRSFEPDKSREEYVVKGRKAKLKEDEVINDINPVDDAGNNRKYKQRDVEIDRRKISDLNAKEYVDAFTVKPDEDAYGRNAYNQKESDKLPVDREVPDVRDAK